jgi:hypothetical protein
MELYLIDEDLYKCIPKEPTPALEGKSHTPLMKKYLCCSSKICFMIQPHCVTSLLCYNSKAGMGQSIKAYQDSGLNHCLGLLTHLFDAVLIHHPIIDAYVADFVYISQQLAHVSAPLRTSSWPS